MRILAVRGENLASLADAFEIDLVHGPLGEAGVFAIVGPTGAGKTTLLDAICVALFDRTPRLANRSPFQISRGDNDPSALGAQDVRTLLRRGATAGWAEVDFEGGDERCYRARWSVRRARGAANGNLLEQQLSLAELNGSERLGGTKTETLRAIQQRLGLSFDQFRRSALLAQGDFAAFLRADGKDRSELLERMTGTQIYSKLSLAAHHRAIAIEQQLRDARGAALAIPVLSDAERAEVEAEFTAARAASETARTQAAAGEVFARWLAEASARTSALVEAELELKAACQAGRDADPLRDELASLRGAEVMRAMSDEVVRLRAHVSTLSRELAAADRSVGEAEVSAHHVAQSRLRLTALHEPVRAARIASRVVEVDCAVAPPADIETMAIAAAAAASWLLERKALATEIAAWPELQSKLAQHRSLGRTIEVATAALEDCGNRRNVLVTRQQHLVGDRDRVKQRFASACSEVERISRNPGIALDAAGRAEDTSRSQLEQLSELAAIAATARRSAAARKALTEQLQRLDHLSSRFLEDRAAIVRQRDIALALRDERLRAVSELRKFAGYAHARTELVAEDPCPLCGSTDHPWAHRGAVDQLIEDGDRGISHAAAQVDAAMAKLAELEAAAFQRNQERDQVQALLGKANDDAHSSTRAWQARRTMSEELSEIADPSTPDAEAIVGSATATAQAHLNEALRIRNEALAAAAALGKAQAHVQTCRSDLERREIQLSEVERSIAAIDAEAARYHGERAAVTAQYQDLTSQIEAARRRWAQALPQSEPTQTAPGRDGPDQLGELDQLATAWQTRSTQVANADAILSAATAEIERRVAAADRVTTAATTRRLELAKRYDDVACQLDSACTALQVACAAAGFEPEQLRHLLNANGERMPALTAQIESIERAIEHARTRVAEHRRIVDAHERQRPDFGSANDARVGAWSQPPTLADLASAVAEAQTRAAQLADALRAAEQRSATLGATLAADSEARDRRDSAWSAFAAAERAAEVDRVLGEIIGSHDGKLFRSFAQSLTLDSLLCAANAHLEQLAPRYQLERVPKHDLELQILDRDFGEEVRSVQSLSGGECFLVSLALALGLSSMSAHDVRVRTLLIDEGFGTLDPSTLDSALAVLDELQATGRQVGIISHVPALLDRVHAHVRISPRGGGRSRVVVPSNLRSP